ncbi:MAG: phosphate ABC transporter permease subunit PstC [bacterium]|nr:phosphate ABC transporter permease subunit PstC [bacterium]
MQILSEPQAIETTPPAEAGRRPRLNVMDRFIHGVVMVSALVVVVLIAGLFAELAWGSRLSIGRFGWRFLASDAWNPVTGEFGALSSLFGTLVTTIIALALAIPLSLAIALYLVELAPPRLAAVVGGAIELLAAIPSIIYGMWGLFLFAPFMADHVQPWLQRLGGGVFLVSGPPMGIGMLTAGLVLALMVLPFITAISRDVFRLVPPVLRESAFGLGATTAEVTRKVTLPYTLRGIVGAAFLGLGRALGETMAVTFVIGNDHAISPSLFASGNTISSTLANEFTEASEPLYLSSLVELGLVLLAITILVQIAAQLWLGWMSRGREEGR